jgi:hypothetical protein
VQVTAPPVHDELPRWGASDAGDAHAWLGDSVGRWEGKTLVVETSGFHPGDTLRGSGLFLGPHTRVTERFTREGPDNLFYQFTVSDPSLFTRPWSAEITLGKAPGRDLRIRLS